MTDICDLFKALSISEKKSDSIEDPLDDLLEGFQKLNLKDLKLTSEQRKILKDFYDFQMGKEIGDRSEYEKLVKQIKKIPRELRCT